MTILEMPFGKMSKYINDTEMFLLEELMKTFGDIVYISAEYVKTEILDSLNKGKLINIIQTNKGRYSYLCISKDELYNRYIISVKDAYFYFMVKPESDIKLIKKFKEVFKRILIY